MVTIPFEPTKQSTACSIERWMMTVRYMDSTNSETSVDVFNTVVTGIVVEVLPEFPCDKWLNGFLLYKGVADGVGGWRDYGVDPSQFSGTLMKTCERLVKEGRFVPSSPVGVLTTSYYELLQNKVPLLGEFRVTFKPGLEGTVSCLGSFLSVIKC